MKKENYGIPAVLLCAAIYLMGLYSAVNTSIWSVVGITVIVFVLAFSSDVRKTAMQALALVLIFCAIYVVLHVLGLFNDMIKSMFDSKTADFSDYLSGSYQYSLDSNMFDKCLSVLRDIVNVAAYGIFIVLAVSAVMGKKLFVAKVHMAVDGFVPVKPVAQQMYAGQQQFNQQPQQAYNQQPQQAYRGQPGPGIYNTNGMHRQQAMQQPQQQPVQQPQQQMYARRPVQTYATVQGQSVPQQAPVQKQSPSDPEANVK